MSLKPKSRISVTRHDQPLKHSASFDTGKGKAKIDTEYTPLGYGKGLFHIKLYSSYGFNMSKNEVLNAALVTVRKRFKSVRIVKAETTDTVFEATVEVSDPK